jgi:integrase
LTVPFLEWILNHRPPKAHRERTRHLQRFQLRHGKLKATTLTGEHLESFRKQLRSSKFALDYIRKHEITVRMMVRWGVNHKHLPYAFDPFSTVEALYIPDKMLLESDLPTPHEVRSIIQHATPALADFVIVQHATGARTGELRGVLVGDFQPRTGQLLIRHHKREKTMREPIPRVITLNDRAKAVVARRCTNRKPGRPIFTGPSDRPWSEEILSYHWRRTALKAGIRPAITPYSLRHLWISEALMAGLEALLVARMAGTSVNMIERVYGRFRSQSLSDAQARLDASRLQNQQ